MSQGGFIGSTLPPATAASANVVLSDVPCDSTVYVGAVVRMSTSGEAVNALADSRANSNAIGICQEKSGSTLCTVRVLGVTPSIYLGLDVAENYYLSDTVEGGLVATPPTATGHIMLKIGQPYSAGEMLVNIGSRTVRL